MENNQNNNPAPSSEKKSNGHGGKGHHRPHHRHKGKPEGEKKPANTGIDKTFFGAKDAAPAAAPDGKGGDKKNGHQRKNHRGRHGGNKEVNAEKQISDRSAEQKESKAAAEKSGNKKNNDRRRGNRNPGRRANEQRPYDPYEESVAAELSLEELRARIVLKPREEDKPQKPVEPVSAEAVEAILASDALHPVTDNTEKEEVIGVRFRSSGKTYYFAPEGKIAKKGDFVVVETARGAEFGEVSLSNTMINKSDIVSPLRPVTRLATEADVERDRENREKEKEALAICQEKIAAHKLEMKLIDVQYAFDNSKLLFYFSAEGRVDFRELVKDLASTFRTRIELRQIGIRDEAKLLGGLGACGRALCCSTFLPDFAQVSIKMAKDQSLSLNSSKISGLCGRLMCCLRYEQDVYAEEIKKTPDNGTQVQTEDGLGTVISSNPLAGTVRVVLKDAPDAPPKQYHRSAVTVLGKARRDNDRQKTEQKNKTDKDAPPSREAPADQTEE